MNTISFIAAECADTPEDAWGRLKALHSLRKHSKLEHSEGVLEMKYFHILFIPGSVEPWEIASALYDNLIPVRTNTAFCIDAGGGEFIFFGRKIIHKQLAPSPLVIYYW